MALRWSFLMCLRSQDCGKSKAIAWEITRRATLPAQVTGVVSVELNSPGFPGGSDLPLSSLLFQLLNQAVCCWTRMRSNSIGDT